MTAVMTSGVSNSEIVERFLMEEVECKGMAQFNVAALTKWVNANYAQASGEPFTNGQTGRMLKHYSYCNRRKNPDLDPARKGLGPKKIKTVRKDAFIPAYGIDCTMGGGIHAMWFITTTPADQFAVAARTAADNLNHDLVRYVERQAPDLANHPSVVAMIENAHSQSMMAAKGVDLLIKSLRASGVTAP